MALLPVDPRGGVGRRCAGLCAGGTPALPGGLHPMSSSHQGDKVAEALWWRLLLCEVNSVSCAFVVRLHCRGCARLCAGGTPALPGGLHPMGSSHQGDKVAEAFGWRLLLCEVNSVSCAFVVRLHCRGCASHGAGGTPALPGGLHPMGSSHQGDKVAGIYWRR